MLTYIPRRKEGGLKLIASVFITVMATLVFSFAGQVQAEGMNMQGGIGGVEEENTIECTSPEEGDIVVEGEELTVLYTFATTGQMTGANIALSTDGGATFDEIANDTDLDGNFTFTIPEGSVTEEAFIRVQGINDAGDVLAEDTCGPFTIEDDDMNGDNGDGIKVTICHRPPGNPENEMTIMVPVSALQMHIDHGDTIGPCENGENGKNGNGYDNMAPYTDKTGTSPVNGEVEKLSKVNPGDYITGASFPAVYYVDENMVRHPFMNKQTFYTWQNSFVNVKTVTDATLPTLSMGDVMLPKAGDTLVKTPHDPSVYAIEENASDPMHPTLRKIASEDVATEMYGPRWSDMIMDIPSTMVSKYAMGDEIQNASEMATAQE